MIAVSRWLLNAKKEILSQRRNFFVFWMTIFLTAYLVFLHIVKEIAIGIYSIWVLIMHALNRLNIWQILYPICILYPISTPDSNISPRAKGPWIDIGLGLIWDVKQILPCIVVFIRFLNFNKPSLKCFVNNFYF